MWICPECDAHVEPSFEVCWRCGTTETGEEDPDFVTADEAEPIGLPTDYLKLEAGELLESDLPEPPLDAKGGDRGLVRRGHPAVIEPILEVNQA